MSTSEDEALRSTRAHRWLPTVSLVIVAAAAVMGWAASFVGLHAYAQHVMVGFNWHTAWLLPATFDGAAFACTLMTYRASIAGRSAMRGRALMWAFTAISSWINWIHQTTLEARLVAAGLPVAAVAVFDIVLTELRADYEAQHGRQAFRMRPGLLALRWLVDRSGTTADFRNRITSIPTEELVGLGTTGTEAAQQRQPNISGAARVPVEWQMLPQARSENAVADGGRVSAVPDVVPERQSRNQELAAEGGTRAAGNVRLPLAADDRAAGGTEAAHDAARVPERAAEQTAALPAVPGPGDDREAARELVRQDPDGWTGARLAERFGRSERWGRAQIAAVRAEQVQARRSSISAVK